MEYLQKKDGPEEPSPLYFPISIRDDTFVFRKDTEEKVFTTKDSRERLRKSLLCAAVNDQRVQELK